MTLYHLVAVVVLNAGGFHWITPPNAFEAVTCNEIMDNVVAAANDGIVLFAECFPIGEKNPYPLFAWRAPVSLELCHHGDIDEMPMLDGKCKP